MRFLTSRPSGFAFIYAGAIMRARTTATFHLPILSTSSSLCAPTASPSRQQIRAMAMNGLCLRKKVKLPPDKVLIPGVIESKSNFVEHPELIANRIGNYAKLVGRENVIAGSDCGFGTWVGQAAVDPDVVWAKFTAMAE